MSAPLASLAKVFEVEYASEPDQFLAFVAEWARLRREMGDKAFWAAVDEVIAQMDRRCDDVATPNGIRTESRRNPSGKGSTKGSVKGSGSPSDALSDGLSTQSSLSAHGGLSETLGRLSGEPRTVLDRPETQTVKGPEIQTVQTLNRDVTPQSGVTG